MKIQVSLIAWMKRIFFFLLSAKADEATGTAGLTRLTFSIPARTTEDHGSA